MDFLIFIGLVVGGGWLYKKWKKSREPQYIWELEANLNTARTWVLDTNIILDNPYIVEYITGEIIIPMGVQ